MNKLAEFYNNSDVDALLLVSGSNILYATAYKADYAYVLMTKSAIYYLTDSRFTIEAKAFLSSDYVIVDVNTLDVFTKMRDILDTENVKTIAFDTDISFYQYRDIIHELTKYTLTDVTDKIVAIRAQKADDEINNIIAAQQIAEKSLSELIPYIIEGVTELELAAKLECFMRINGSSGASFSSIVAFGENSAFAHARPSNRRLQSGDVILIDFGATFNGYCSDMTRTFVFGEARQDVVNMYNAVLDANNRAIDAIRGGMSAQHIDAVARDVLAEYSLDKYFTHSLGHGVGIDIHEFPSMSPRAKDIMLSSGMVVTIEPGVYIEGAYGIRIEDMIVIQDGACRNLTTFSKQLIVINR